MQIILKEFLNEQINFKTKLNEENETESKKIQTTKDKENSDLPIDKAQTEVN